MSDTDRGRIETILNCRYPIVLAGMGGVARADLVGAVSAAGGFGFLGMVREPVHLIRREVEALRLAGHSSFGVNIIPAATGKALLEAQIQTIIELDVPVVGLFWEIDGSVVRRFRDAGVTVVYQVGSAEEAKQAVAAGAQVVIAQGREAGGHVRGNVPLHRLLPSVCKTVAVPVLAAGGLASGSDLIVAKALGAAGIVLGTVLIAAEESFAHEHHRQRLVGAGAHDTLLTDRFHINWPEGAMVRVLRSAVTEGGRGVPGNCEAKVIGEEEGRPIYLFSTDSPLRSMSGDFEAMALYAGTGVGKVHAVRPAGAIIAAILAEAAALSGGGALDMVETASPVCYAGEMSGAYMGLLDADEARTEIAGLMRMLYAALAAALANNGDRDNRPPFSPEAEFFARHILALLPYGDEDGEVQPGEALPGSMLQRLRQVLPRLPENRCRQALQLLALELEAAVETSVAPAQGSSR